MIKIAIASGKGGTGKTLIATNIFHTLVKRGVETILVDCDAEAPNDTLFFTTRLISSEVVSQMAPEIDTDKCIYCGKCQEYCSYNAIFMIPHIKMIRIIDELCHGCGACLVACNADAITEKQVSLGVVKTFDVFDKKRLIEASTYPGAMSPVPVIKSAIRQAKDFSGVIILDSPPGTSCPFIHTSDSSDYVILVTEPTPFGLSDLKQSIETLRGINKPFGVIINRAGIGNNEVYDWIKKHNIELLMEIPFDRNIAGVYSQGELLDEAEYGSSFMSLILKVQQITLKYN